MSKILIGCVVLLLSFGLCLQQADARRFGGGRSFGHYNTSVSRTSRAPSYYGNPASSANANKASAASSGMGRWLGPLAGLAAGGLLASLLMGHGLGGGLMTILLIVGILFFASRFLLGRMGQTVAMQNRNNNRAGDNAYSAATPWSGFNPNVVDAASMAPNDPPGFDAEVFLRAAKSEFIRLQAAYDTKNLKDLREFTTPEVYAEIALQFQERGDAENITEVVTLNAELLQISSETSQQLASVRFSGVLREQPNTPAEPFTEIWHFQKDTNTSWLVSGVQQV